MHNYNVDRARFAANALVYLAIAFGVLSFWSDAIAAGGAVDYLVAALLTVAFGSVSLLLSGVVSRFAEAREAGATFTAWASIGLGLILGLIEAGMTHQGLAWLNARHPLAPDWLLAVAAFGLSAFNVAALAVFVREIKPAKPRKAADLVAFGSHQERRTLAEVADRLRAAGAL